MKPRDWLTSGTTLKLQTSKCETGAGYPRWGAHERPTTTTPRSSTQRVSVVVAGCGGHAADSKAYKAVVAVHGGFECHCGRVRVRVRVRWVGGSFLCVGSCPCHWPWRHHKSKVIDWKINERQTVGGDTRVKKGNWSVKIFLLIVFKIFFNKDWSSLVHIAVVNSFKCYNGISLLLW